LCHDVVGEAHEFFGLATEQDQARATSCCFQAAGATQAASGSCNEDNGAGCGAHAWILKKYKARKIKRSDNGENLAFEQAADHMVRMTIDAVADLFNL
jgi:hypothetical protein